MKKTQLVVTPGYFEAFGEAPTMEVLLKGVPSTSVIQVLCILNAQLVGPEAETRDKALFRDFAQGLSAHEKSILNKRLMELSQRRGAVRLFTSPYVTHFLHYELHNYRDLPYRPPSTDVFGRILKAYLLVVDLYNEHLCSIPDVDPELPDIEWNNRRTWSIAVPQFEFNRRVDPVFTLAQLHVLFDELERTEEFKGYAASYCARFGCKDGFHLVRHFLSVLRISHTNQNELRIAKFQATENLHTLLDQLCHKPQQSLESWTPQSLKTLKQFPFYRTREGEYYVLNWDFFYRATYEAIIRDFYEHSGIRSYYKDLGAEVDPVKRGNFKSWVSGTVIEKRFFQTLLKIMYKSQPSDLSFTSEPHQAESDAYVRYGRYLALIECKDTDIPETTLMPFDYDSYVAELSIKHLRNRGGRPKTLLQLDRNAGVAKTGNYPKHIYATHRPDELWVIPVLVCSGYHYSMPGMNEHLNELYLKHCTTRTGPLIVVTLEYLFHCIVALQNGGLVPNLLKYHAMRQRNWKAFRKNPVPDSWLAVAASIEQVCPIEAYPYHASKSFIREFYKTLGVVHN